MKEPVEGEVAYVNIPFVKVVFEWSNNIVADVDEFDNPVEYKSGWIMKTFPETFVWNGEDFKTICFTTKV